MYDAIIQKVISYKIEQILAFEFIINFIENYWHIIYKTNFPKYFPFAHIHTHILCRFMPCLIRPKPEPVSKSFVCLGQIF